MTEFLCRALEFCHMVFVLAAADRNGPQLAVLTAPLPRQMWPGIATSGSRELCAMRVGPSRPTQQKPPEVRCQIGGRRCAEDPE